jgi:hypothetical protein
MIYQEIPTIEVSKQDLPYPKMIRSAFDRYERCGAVKFLPMNNDLSLFSGYQPTVG